MGLRILDTAVFTRRAKSACLRLRYGPTLNTLPPRSNWAYLVSYPKSGNTWLRFLLGYLLRADVTFANIDRVIPDIYQTRKREVELTEALIMKSHEVHDARYRKVVYLIRDPRSVAISYYHFCRKMHPRRWRDFSTFFEAFLEGQVGRWHTWEQHVLSWTNNSTTNPLIIRYEDVLESQASQLERIAKYLCVPCSKESVGLAVRRASFESMQKDEARNGANWRALQHAQGGGRFVRSGRPDEWRELLSKDQVRQMYQRWGKTMRAFGYGE